METKTLNQWMRLWGYNWEPGREQLLKGELTALQAEDELQRLQRVGAVRRG